MLKYLNLRKCRNAIKIYLGKASARVVFLEDEESKEKELPSYVLSAEAYLQALADFLREELSWNSELGEQGICFLLASELLDRGEFYLPKLSRKDEKREINWELTESLNIDRENFYFTIYKSAELVDEKYAYTVYGAKKDLVDKLIGMVHGFGRDLLFIAPHIETKSVVEHASYDFCPEDMQCLKLREVVTKNARNFFMASMVITLVLMGFFEFEEYHYTEKLHDAEDQLKLHYSLEENYEVAQALKNETEALESLVKRLDAQTIKQSKILESLGKSGVVGVWIKSVTSQGKNYRVQGSSLDMLGVNAWVEETMASSDFKNVKVISTEAREKSISFVAVLGEK